MSSTTDVLYVVYHTTTWLSIWATLDQAEINGASEDCNSFSMSRLQASKLDMQTIFRCNESSLAERFC